MRPPRHLIPGRLHSVSVRCANREHRLRPDSERVQLVGYWLAKAHQACTGISLFAVVQMSNHLHLELQDTRSELSNFMRRFLGPLAKDLNFIDNRSGQVFERRYDAIPILDSQAMRDRIVYALLNPVRARLVAHYEEWQGICVWAHHPEGPQRTFRRIQYRAYERACLRQEIAPKLKDFTQEASLCAQPFVHIQPEEVLQRVHEGEAECVGPPLGMAACVAVPPTSAPTQYARPTRRPLCHATHLYGPVSWYAYLDEWRTFVEAYRRASLAFRAGELDVEFPPHTFSPSMPVRGG